MSNSKDDPRDSSLEVPYSFPPTWHADHYDGLSTSGMFLSGLVMVTRNRLIAWPGLFFALNQLVNSHPLRSKEAGSGWTNVLLCVSALIAAYVPMFVITQKT